MSKQNFFHLTLVALILGILVVQTPTLAVDPDQLDLELSYSTEDKTEFTGEYWWNRIGLGIYYEDERYQPALLLKTAPDVKLKFGYDLTEDSYLAGLDGRWRLGDNLVVDAELNRFWPDGEDGIDYWDYKAQLDIGIGRANYISPGVEGYHAPDNQPDPELYIHFDLNWGFAEAWNLKYEPHILVEGEFEHRMTLTKDFTNGIQAGLFAEQEREKDWAFGVVFSY